MASPEVEQQFKAILAAANGVLKPAGFRKSGSTFRLFAEGNCAIVNFQRSQSSTADELKFTINTGVVSRRLFEARKIFENDKLETSKESDAHLRQRIGWLLPDKQDKWWILSGSRTASTVVAEIAAALADLAVPYLSAHLTDEALIATWESGQCPGLTEKQRVSFLAELKSAAT